MHDGYPEVLVGFLLLYFFAMASLFFTSFSDPGIVPRSGPPVELNGDQHMMYPFTGVGTDRQIMVNGTLVTLRYCG